MVGGGHAGCEAALACARIGLKTLLLTGNVDTIALMSCNPAIGGLAKGQLVREIDALGGEMGKCIDATGIQFRVLNTSKGPAVQAYRAQADRNLYRIEMKKRLEAEERLHVKEAMVEEILVKNGQATGVSTDQETSYTSKAVVIAAGTFLNGLIHIGLRTYPAGRAGEFPSTGLSKSLRALGFRLGRLKTGTPPRLDSKTIDFRDILPQYGDREPHPFSYATERITRRQIPCFLTHTNADTHRIIEDNLDRSPLYSGVITGIGPRYCPSIEDKIKRFRERERHQVFLEPEGYDTTEYYPNGVSTSLPVDVQQRFLRTIKGLEQVEMVRPGYAIEYDFVFPTQLTPTLETKLIANLFHAGQINGTSGYEEAAAQGIIAGINAAMKALGRDPLILGREDAYIGVMIDDLVTKGTEEPYRMFTSRAEYRLQLRNDNADIRLSEKGYRAGLLKKEEYDRYLVRKEGIEKEIRRLKTTFLKKDEMPEASLREPVSLEDILKRPGIHYSDLPAHKAGDPGDELKERAETVIKYEGYIKRQRIEIERFKKIESVMIPAGIEYKKIPGLSNEIKQKLEDIQPVSAGQASRVPGVTPAAITALLAYLKNF